MKSEFLKLIVGLSVIQKAGQSYTGVPLSKDWEKFSGFS